MDSFPSVPGVAVATVVPYHHNRTGVSWAAILGGLVAALALQVLFVLLGAGLGFALYNPLTSDSPVADLGAGSVVIHGISAVCSLWFGGWVAGRFTPVVSRASGGLHGFLVWCSATVAGVLIVSLGAGWLLGDLSKLVGGGLSAAGKPAAAAVTAAGSDLAKDALKQSSDTISSYVDEALANRSPNADRAGAITAKREVGLALARLFNPANEGSKAENRAAVTRALVQSGLSQSEAERLVNSWTESYERLRADLAAAKDAAEEKAREAADKAAKALTVFSLTAFFAFILGATAASCGGRQGAAAAFKRDYGVGLTA
jgi:hypothetical protein